MKVIVLVFFTVFFLSGCYYVASDNFIKFEENVDDLSIVEHTQVPFSLGRKLNSFPSRYMLKKKNYALYLYINSDIRSAHMVIEPIDDLSIPIIIEPIVYEHDCGVFRRIGSFARALGENYDRVRVYMARGRYLSRVCNEYSTINSQLESVNRSIKFSVKNAETGEEIEEIQLPYKINVAKFYIAVDGM